MQGQEEGVRVFGGGGCRARVRRAQVGGEGVEWVRCGFGGSLDVVW